MENTKTLKLRERKALHGDRFEFILCDSKKLNTITNKYFDLAFVDGIMVTKG